MITPKQIKRSATRKLTLKIDDKGDLIVTAPYNLSNSEIFTFVEQKQAWIRKKQNEIKSVLLQNQKIINLEEIFYLGKRCEIKLVEGIKSLEYRNLTIMLPVNSNKKKLIKEFFLKEAEKVLIFRLNYLTELMKISMSGCNIISSKTKWGMCDSKKFIYLNYKLVMLPPDIIDYVIVHELSHLVQMNHSKNFWKLVEAVIPDYKKKQEVLKYCNFLIKMF